LWDPVHDDVVPIKENCVFVMGDKVFLAKNTVTDAGDLYYSELIDRVNVSYPGDMTNLFKLHEGQSDRPTIDKSTDRSAFANHIVASQATTDAGYPKRNDSDVRNPTAGTDVITHRVSYPAPPGVANITGWIITNESPAANEPVLCAFEFASFEKLAGEELQVFVNHEIGG
jgi:hypothetical protein